MFEYVVLNNYHYSGPAFLADHETSNGIAAYVGPFSASAKSSV